VTTTNLILLILVKAYSSIMPKPKFLLKEAGAGGKNKQKKKKGRHQHSVSEIYFEKLPSVLTCYI
jgi:hypothetical protein